MELNQKGKGANNMLTLNRQSTDIWSKLTNENCNFEISDRQFSLIREWIRENEEHDHNLPLPVFDSIHDARNWCERVAGEERKAGMEQNSFEFIINQLSEILK